MSEQHQMLVILQHHTHLACAIMISVTQKMSRYTLLHPEEHNFLPILWHTSQLHQSVEENTEESEELETFWFHFLAYERERGISKSSLYSHLQNVMLSRKAPSQLFLDY